MATMQRPCSTCGATATVAFGQRLLGGELRWSGRETCSSCDAIVEFDDFGDIPDELKPAILEDEGEWELVLSDGADRLAALKVLRDRLGVSIGQAKEKLSALRDTRVTLEWIQDGFARVGVESVLNRLTPPTAATNDVTEAID